MSQTAHIKLYCTSSSLLLERVLQAARYRGFRITDLQFSELPSGMTEIGFSAFGQGKLTTLKKSLETLIEVQQCYLSEDEAELPSLLDMGQKARPNLSHTAQQVA